jgi:hypothetical protein
MSEYGKIETLFERDEKTFKVRVGEIKNRTYSLLKTWHWTEKVDGTNIRCVWQNNTVTFGGRTDNAQIHADLTKWLYENVTAEKMRAAFPDGSGAVLYGEGYGSGIQKGGGDYCPEKRLILFDVLVDAKWWLNYEAICDVGDKLGLAVVPSFGEMMIEEAADLVREGIRSRCAINISKMAEGLVGRPTETLFDKKGHRLITKIKTKDF